MHVKETLDRNEKNNYELTNWYAYNVALNECLNNHPCLFIQDVLKRFHVELSINIDNYYVCITGIKKNVYFDIYNITAAIYVKIIADLKKELHNLILSNNFYTDIFLSTKEDDKQLVILISPTNNSSCSLEKLVKQISKKSQEFIVKNIFKNNSIYHTTTSISKNYSGLESIREGYYEARYLNDLSFFSMSSNIHSTNWLFNVKKHNESTIHLQCKKVISALDAHSEKSLKYLDDLFNIYLKYSFDFELISEICIILLRGIRLRSTVYNVSLNINKQNFIYKNHIIIESLYSTFVPLVEQLLKHMVSQPKHTLYTLNSIYYIKENYNHDISLLDIAEFVGIDSSYLSNQFKHITGMNISNFLYKYRLEQAKILLNTTNMNVSEIASCVGYHDVKYFSRNYKQMFGNNPSEDRKKYNP